MGCKNCGCDTNNSDEVTDPQLAASGPLKAIARFRSLAECGFFADELTAGADIACQTQTQDEFDGLTDAWRPWYVLFVRDEDAEKAINFLGQKISANEQAAPIDDQFDENSSEYADAPDPFANQSDGSWLLPVLTSVALTAGAMWWLSNAWGKPKSENASVVAELARIDQEWTQSSSTGRVVRRMTFDQQEQSVKILEDSNGDGDFDRTQSFDF